MPNPASAFPAAPPRFFDRGSGAKLLQPANQVPYDAAPSAATVRDALIAAGIMKAS